MATDEYKELSLKGETAVQSLKGAPDPGLTQWQLSPVDLLISFEHELRGERLVPDPSDPTRGIWKQEGERIMNDIGIRITLLGLGNINKNILLSDLNEKDVAELIFNFLADYALLYTVHGEEFDLKKQYRDMIMSTMATMLLGAFKRALYGGERVFITKSGEIKRVETFSGGQQAGKPKAWWKP